MPISSRGALAPVLGASAVTLAFLAPPVMAHVSIAPAHAPANTYLRVALQVPHGCAGAATTAIEVTLPEGVTVARPMPKPGWSIAIALRPIERPLPTEHGLVRQAPAAIAWSDGVLADAHYDEFVMQIRTPARSGPLAFPVIQRCEGGAVHAWTELPTEATPRPRSPAPTLTLGER